jgi:hypothetical protein
MATKKTVKQRTSAASAPKARPQSTKGARKSAPAGVETRLVRATQPLKREFEKVRATIGRLRSRGSEAFDELYEEIGRVLESDPPLYVGGGYRTKEDFIAAELPGETLRSVQRNVLVARSFSPRDETRHGIGFLEEVALYAKELAAAGEAPRAIDLDRLTLTLRGKGGETLRRKARDATIDDVRKARRALRRGGRTRKDASPAEAAIRAALGRHSELAQVAVRAGAEAVSFGGVPLSALGALARALRDVKLPAER